MKAQSYVSNWYSEKSFDINRENLFEGFDFGG